MRLGASPDLSRSNPALAARESRELTNFSIGSGKEHQVQTRFGLLSAPFLSTPFLRGLD